MAIDLSKISQTQLDRIIKEEALKIKAEMLNETALNPRQRKLMEEKLALEKELGKLDEMADLEEGIFGSLFGSDKGADKNGAARKQAVLNLLKHPQKVKVLLTYATPEQVAEFKSYMPADKQSFIDWTIRKLPNKIDDAARADSYIQFHMNGGNNPAWDAAKHQYLDAGQVKGSVSSAFGEGEAPQS